MGMLAERYDISKLYIYLSSRDGILAESYNIYPNYI